MEKVGMCVKVLLSQTKIIKPFTYIESIIESDTPKGYDNQTFHFDMLLERENNSQRQG